jgi:hypothetical protein
MTATHQPAGHAAGLRAWSFAAATLLSASNCVRSSPPVSCEPPPENLVPWFAPAQDAGAPTPSAPTPSAVAPGDAAAPAATAALDRAPARLGVKVAHRLLAINPHVRPYKVVVPGACGNGLDSPAVVRICVSARGAVTSVDILLPSVPLVDRQLPAVIARWSYRPWLRDGQPAPFCYDLPYRVRPFEEPSGWLF